MIIKEILDNLYGGDSPYKSCDLSYIDNGYPHTNMDPDLVRILTANIEPRYIVECGSMTGGSAMIMARISQKPTICIDPFTGDVNMWDWEKDSKYKFLRLENGIPTIYKRFLANCKSQKLDNLILPINCTTMVGIKLLTRLYKQHRISSLPNYLYLDSAHEKDETFLELKVCWDILGENSILFGDDWNWAAVKEDVVKFANAIYDEIDRDQINRIHRLLTGSTIECGNILLYKNQWVLIKRS